MKSSNKMAAMLLAGGQGSRLKTLTKNVAKPAVPFGGKYAIIDFALSNAANSDIHDIGVLTQYKPFKLNEHLGIGSPWDFDRNHGGLRSLSPYYSEEGGRWYDGTANAIYENIDYLDSVGPDYVLILSGDHIYKMDYNKMLQYHQSKGAECTIAIMEVPWDEASRFGILNADENGKITSFDEKPEVPKSNTASMGIYIFNWPTLRKALIEDYNDPDSEYDFGKNIIPKMLASGAPMFTYRFEGYWKDVGTVKSFWEANLDLIDPDNTLDIYDSSWRIYTTSRNYPPQYVGPDAEIEDSMINEGCRISGEVTHSVLFAGVVVEKGAKVIDSVLLPGVVVKAGAVVRNAVINTDYVVEGDQKIGQEDSDVVYLVSEDGIIE